ncbi:MAG: Lrp/AsnC family transcriptional regulator [Firmicutes bacterium]|nr:Lrp/AsnC family transcriptional regulator [Bacillota bacterium]
MDDLDREILKRLQGDIAVAPRPFLEMAEAMGIDEVDLLDRAARLQSQGVIRRFGAILRHRQSGIGGNAMVVWAVPTDEVDRLGVMFSMNPSVTHCYARPTRPGWRYNLYTMIHAADPAGCEKLARQMADEAGAYDFEMLFGTREFKKTSMNYFAHLDKQDE